MFVKGARRNTLTSQVIRGKFTISCTKITLPENRRKSIFYFHQFVYPAERQNL